MTSQENKDKWHADLKNWKLGILYFNKEDVINNVYFLILSGLCKAISKHNIKN